MRLVIWLLRAFLFFALFAFALNNRDTVVVNWFFGVQWPAPLVIVVLIAFGLGCAVGVLAMVPAWWAKRRHAIGSIDPAAPGPRAPATASAPTDFGASHPPREGP